MRVSFRDPVCSQVGRPSLTHLVSDLLGKREKREKRENRVRQLILFTLCCQFYLALLFLVSKYTFLLLLLLLHFTSKLDG